MQNAAISNAKKHCKIVSHEISGSPSRRASQRLDSNSGSLAFTAIDTPAAGRVVMVMQSADRRTRIDASYPLNLVGDDCFNDQCVRIPLQ
jgi:hypothetical protein